MSGFKGKKNVYMCPDCGHGFVSQDVDAGVTPMTTSCLNLGCSGMASSFFYNIPQDFLARFAPTLEWYMPTEAEIKTLRRAQRKHVKMGGLLSRPGSGKAVPA